ncbi:MAG: hypothetical protein NT069_30420 [Planctomycetota bacterium]|nr:hypothetical protein [Planctomycetota bacterium]
MKSPPRPGVRLLTVNLILLTAIVALLLYSGSYWSNFFGGPYLSDRTLFDTGWVGQMERNGKPLYADKFFAMPVRDRFLLVMADSPEEGRKLVGSLYRISSPVEKQVFQSAQKEHPEWKGKLLPVMINGKAAFKVVGYLGLATLLPMLTISMVNIARAVVKLSQ